MKINLLCETISVADFYEETNAVFLHMPELDPSDHITQISEKELKSSKYLGKREIDGEIYFKSDEYASDHPEINCTIKYPLSNPCDFKIYLAKYKWNENEDRYYFDLENIVDQICNKYREIYSEEEKTALLEIRSESTPEFNRSRTDGKWGIWGHDIEDLVIEGLILDTNKNKISLLIGS